MILLRDFKGGRGSAMKRRLIPEQIMSISKPSDGAVRILLVDDNPQNLELLEVYMEALPEAEVMTATNGQEAMEKVAASPPDLILLDIMMPKTSGFEVCKRIKADPKTRDIIVVMVTALSETGDVERAAECGADDYVTKPLDRKALIELIRGLLAARARG
ncbi:MAG: hypothetical protein AMXMBFR22_20430 [Phycisphaerae bacterium]